MYDKSHLLYITCITNNTLFWQELNLGVVSDRFYSCSSSFENLSIWVGSLTELNIKVYKLLIADQFILDSIKNLEAQNEHSD